MSANTKVVGVLEMEQGPLDLIRHSPGIRQELSQAVSRPTAAYNVPATPPNAGPDTPTSFDWTPAPVWDASNPPNDNSYAVAPGEFVDYLNYGNVTDAICRFSSDASSTASLNLGSGGTASFAWALTSGATYKVRWAFNGNVTKPDSNAGYNVSGNVGTVVWSSDNPAAFTQSGNNFRWVVGQTATYIELEFTATNGGFTEVSGPNGGWELVFTDYGNPIGAGGGDNYNVSFSVVNGVEYYQAVKHDDVADVLSGEAPVPVEWSPVQESAAASSSTIIDSSAAATDETLPAATGSGDIRFFVSHDVTNAATLSVQAGESLNGAVDATFLFSNYAAGTQFRAADKASGEWVVSVVGAADAVNPVVSADVTQITATGTNVIYSGVPTTGQSLIESVDYRDIGSSLREVFLVANMFEDDQATFTIGSDICPVGAEIISATSVHMDGSAVNAGDHRPSTYVQNSNQVVVNRDNTDQAGAVRTGVRMVIKGTFSGSEYVLAGMVQPEALSRIQVSLSATTNSSGATQYAFDQVTTPDPSGGLSLVSSGNVGAVAGLKAGKTYRLTANMQLLSPGAGNADLRFVDLTNNVTIGEGFEVVTATFATNVSSQPGIALYTPPTDCEVGVDFVVGNAGEMSSRSTFTVEQLPNSTVVDPGSVTPVGLHRFSAHNTSNDNLVTVAGGSAVPFRLDLDDNSASGIDQVYDPNGLLSGETVVIQQSGVYRIEYNVGYGDATVLFARVGLNDTAIMDFVIGTTRDGQTGVDIRALNAGDVLDFGFNSDPTGNVDHAFITVEQLPDSTVVAPLAVPANRYFFSWDTNSVPSLAGVTALVPVDEGSVKEDIGGLASYSGANSEWTFTSGDKPLKITTNLASDGTGTTTAIVHYWSDPAALADSAQSAFVAVTGMNGSLGQDVNVAPSQVYLLPNSTFTARLSHQASSNNQRVQTGSFIIVEEI